MGLTVPPETNLHVGKKFGRIGSHCTTRRGGREEAGPTVPLGRNCEVGKKLRSLAGMGLTMFPGTNLQVEKTMDRTASNCTTRQELERTWVPL